MQLLKDLWLSAKIIAGIFVGMIACVFVVGIMSGGSKENVAANPVVKEQPVPRKQVAAPVVTTTPTTVPVAADPPVQEVEVSINAEVLDRSGDTLLMWGYALYSGGPLTSEGHAVSARNIVLRKAEGGIVGARWGQIACYKGRTEGSNAFGANVPAFIYGPCRRVSHLPPRPPKQRTPEEEIVQAEALRVWRGPAGSEGCHSVVCV